jgi:hypothetical protein
MKEEILEIIQHNYEKFTGTNEAELHSSEEIELLFEKELNRFFLYFRDNGERLLGASIEQLVKSYLKSR